MQRRCNSCLFGDKCDGNGCCDNYYPIGEEAEDIMVERLIEDNRKGFHIGWKAYINSQEL